VIDVACSLSLIAAALIVPAAYARRLAQWGPATHPRLERAGSSPLLGRRLVEMGYWALRPAARAFIAADVSADAVSWLSLALAGLAGTAVALGRLGVGAALAAASALCDALDGMVARETGTASPAGEVLDAAIDRYTELFLFGAIVVFAHDRPAMVVLALAASAGAVMVSYATAKAEALGVEAPRGLMRRQERAVYLVIGLALTPVFARVRHALGLSFALERAPLVLALGLIAAIGNASAVQRLRAIAVALGTRRGAR
jgi:CDP-diacylglycerol--glycerol-3-phosphate 3-phosphatidyltransferase